MTHPQIDTAISYLQFLASVSDERLARVAARRAFVEAKQQAMRSAGRVRGAMGPLLLREARLATTFDDLCRLRHGLLAHLPTEAHEDRDALHRHLALADDQDVSPR